MSSPKNIVSFSKTSRRGGSEETEFLPAALEIAETPASPLGRVIVATIIAIFCFFMGWASLSHVDIVASASGKIIPAGGTKVIQPLEMGIVRAIHTLDGQHVRVGDVLVELDPAINQSDRDHFRSDLLATDLEIARLKAALANTSDPIQAFHPPSGATPAQVTMQRDYLIQQTAEHRAKIAALDRQFDQKQAERDTIQATVGKLSAIIPILQERADIRKASSDQEYTSKFQYLEVLQALVEQQQELKVQQKRLREIEANIAALSETRTQTVAEFQRTLYGQLAEAERKADGLQYDVAKSEQKIRAQYLTAPY